jgi:hypothetical protein
VKCKDLCQNAFNNTPSFLLGFFEKNPLQTKTLKNLSVGVQSPSGPTTALIVFIRLIKPLYSYYKATTHLRAERLGRISAISTFLS